ncbi:LacI family DNA-binding transcriptional regulator [Streptomyces sp. NPDC000594]|uniref:LacI family DNA-binding transcriptional regulator n=1 Tax=Streptomyces sp. NPDC000594 TaxID=3154261 RepID=UPI00332405A0
MPRVTIAHVARAAEVSTATVSHALNGTGRLGDSTRRRVRATAEALGYGGRAAFPRTLGLAVTTYGTEPWNFADVPYFAQAIGAATAAAHARGYALTALPSAPAASVWAAVPLAGVLLMDSPADDPVVALLRERGVPLAFDGLPGAPRPGDIRVDNDHRATTRTVLGHLAARGATRIALMSGAGDDHYTRSCLAAYDAWCDEHGRARRHLRLGYADPEGHCFDAPLSAADRPDAIFGIYDPCGHRTLASAARVGLRVPGDLLLVCASEDPAYGSTVPPVSTVSLDPRRTAGLAIDALVDAIECGGPVRERPPLTVPSRLHPRASSAGLRSRPAPG